MTDECIRRRHEACPGCDCECHEDEPFEQAAAEDAMRATLPDDDPGRC